jgi:hypothetical protein
MKYVLLKFNVSKLSLNHFVRFLKSKEAEVSKSTGLSLLMIILVSSAKITGLYLLTTLRCDMAKGKSFIYSRNNNGPKIDPWGTPFLILPQQEYTWPFITPTFCCLSSR